MKTNYTPGEWIINNTVNAAPRPFIVDKDGNTIAMLFNNDGTLPYGRTLEETTANAKLIAAAPELLEALKTTRLFNLHQYGEGTPGNRAYSIIEAAIKKATE